MDSRVYERLAAAKQEGESFSKGIARLLARAASANTGVDILRELAGLPPLGPEHARVFVAVVAENRAREQLTATAAP